MIALLPISFMLLFLGLCCLMHNAQTFSQSVLRVQSSSFGPSKIVNSGFTAAGEGLHGATVSHVDAATQFLARTSGLTAPQQIAYANLIHALTSANLWSKLDWLYIFATNTEATALTNLVSSSYNGTRVGTLTFTPWVGYTGDHATGYIDTGFNPATAGGNMSLNSTSIGIYALTMTGNTDRYDMGVTGAAAPPPQPADGFWAQPYSSNYHAMMNDYDGLGASARPGAGLYVGSRLTSAAARSNGASSWSQVYKNQQWSNWGGGINPVGVPNGNVYIFALDRGGAASNFSGNQLAAAFSGGGLTPPEAQQLANALNNYMATYGISKYSNTAWGLPTTGTNIIQIDNLPANIFGNHTYYPTGHPITDQWSAVPDYWGQGNAVVGVDFLKAMMVDRVNFPNNTTITWDACCWHGIWGYPALQYGSYPGQYIVSTVPSIQVKNINKMSVTHDVTLSGGGIFDVLYDIWLTTAQNGNTRDGGFEIEIMPYNSYGTSGSTLLYTLSGTPFTGTPWDGAQVWKAEKRYCAGGACWQALVIVPAAATSLASPALVSTVDIKAMLQNLATHSGATAVTGNEWISGFQFGIEQNIGGAMAIINRITVDAWN